MNWFSQGMGYQENYLPFYQAGLGHDVLVLCSKHFLKKRKVFQNFKDDIFYQDRKLVVKRLNSLYIGFLTEQNWYLGFKKTVQEFNPDIVHLHDVGALPSLQFLLFKILTKNKVKVFVDSHIDNGNFDFKAPHKYFYYFCLMKKVIIPCMLREDFEFLAVNPYAKYCLEEYFGIPKERIKLLLLGVDSKTMIFSPEKRKSLRNQYNIGNNDIVFVFSGIFEKNKSLLDLLGAFKILAKKYNNIFLLMIGKGNLAVDKEFELLKEEGRIVLIGWLSRQELCYWYSSADVGVLPGKLGGIKDIVAVGRSLIVNDDLAVSYLVDNENGLVFKRNNLGELINAMETYIKNPSLIEKYGKKSLELVANKLSWENIALKSLEVYNEA